MSDLVHYFERNPDPSFATCMNSGAMEDGVVFTAIEPLVGAYTFVGRTNILEAAGLLYGLGQAEVEKALGEGTDKQKQEIAKLKAQLKSAQDAYEELKYLILTAVEGIDGN